LTAHAMPIQEEPHPVADIGDRIEDPGVEQELLALWDEWTGPVEEVHLGEDPLVRGDRQSLHGSPGGPAPSSDVEVRDTPSGGGNHPRPRPRRDSLGTAERPTKTCGSRSRSAEPPQRGRPRDPAHFPLDKVFAHRCDIVAGPGAKPL